MSCDRSRGGGPPGVTLIELLIAVAVSTLILGVGLSAYLTLSSSLRRQHDARSGEAAAALDTLRHDLAACVQASFSNAPSLELRVLPGNGETPDLSMLSFCAGELRNGAEDFSRLEVLQVRLRLQPDGDDGRRYALWRETLKLWGADALGAATSNALLRGVSRFDVAALEGETWTNRWISRPNRPLPRAARITLDWETARTTETTTVVVYIPAGNTIAPPSAARRP